MTKLCSPDIRVLAISPSTKGFGFAVLEGARSLVDWGVKTVRHDKNARCLARIEELAGYYQPRVIILEDYTARDSRRHVRIQELIAKVAQIAIQRSIRVKRFSRSNVSRAFHAENARTKHDIALVIGSYFDELTPRIPPRRRPWKSEDHWMQMFDAVALALTYFRFTREVT